MGQPCANCFHFKEHSSFLKGNPGTTCFMLNNKFDQKTAIIVLSLCLYLIALVLRASGADYGYFHGDERINDAAKVMTGQLVPGQHFYPPLINYLNAVAFAGLFTFGLGTGMWSSPGEFRAAYFEDPTPFYLTARYTTAMISALMAPLFFAFARQAQLKTPIAVWIGLMGALFPLGVFMAHIAKGDSALAVAIVWVFFCLWKRVETKHPKRWDFMTGLGVVLAVSFKHSAVFILGPLAIGWIIILLRREGMQSCLASALRAGVGVLILWPILNIGILLDLENFLEYQEIQSVMSVQEGEGFAVGLTTLAARSLDLYWGLNPVIALLVLLTPLGLLARRVIYLPNRDVLWVIWGSLMVGSLMTAYITGSRQPEHLWIANFAGFLLLACMVLGSAAAVAERGWRIAALSVGGVATLLAVVGAAVPVSQAMAVPVTEDLEAYLNRNFGADRILTSQPLGVQQHALAQDMELQRLDRLAKKYNVELPEMAPERLIRNTNPNALFYVNAPSAMYGLEDVDEEDVNYEVKAHSWPLQKEEWQLGYWRDKGFRILVVRDLDYLLTEVSSDLMRDYYQSVAEQCLAVKTFEARKPLFLERPVTVFEC